MQNLPPGRPGVIRPQVGQALGSLVFAPPETGGEGGVPVTGADGLGAVVGIGGFAPVGVAAGLTPPPALPGTGGLIAGFGGFG
jgi:hypothetical protein